MADLVIPKGKDYTFTVKVIEKNSFLAQDLTTMTSATMNLIDIVTGANVVTVTMTVKDAINGLLHGTITAADTGNLTVTRGPKEDGYYLKAGYQGAIEVQFSDIDSINVLIAKVLVSPTGV